MLPMSILSYNNRSNKKENEQTTFLVSKDCFPQTIEVLKVRANPIGIKLKIVDEFVPTDDVFGIICQYPSKYGSINNIEDIIKEANEKNIIRQQLPPIY